VLALSFAAPAAAERLWTVDVTTGVRTAIADGARVQFLGGACFGADGSLLVLEQRRAGLRYVAYGGARRALARTASANGVIWAPGCGRAAERRRRLPGTTRPGVLVRDPAGGPLARLPAYWPLEGPSLAWSADGARIADVDDRRRRDAVRVTDAATGRELARAGAVHDAALVFAGGFSPDGSQVAFVDFDLAGAGRSDVRVLDVATGAVRLLASVPSASHTPWATWSPAGDRIAVAVDDALHLFDLEGRDLGVVAPGSRVYEVVWSPDGTRLAFTSIRPGRRFRTRLHVVDAAVGAPARVLGSTSGAFSGPPAWSPDGARLAVGGR
jgi:Tol biopolymer transport system component